MAPSIATSLTLMVPGLATAKAAGALGKFLGLSKAATKAANLVNMGQKTRDIIATGAKNIIGGTTMRLLENYQEAEVWSNLYEADLMKIIRNDMDNISDNDSIQYHGV